MCKQVYDSNKNVTTIWPSQGHQNTPARLGTNGIGDWIGVNSCPFWNENMYVGYEWISLGNTYNILTWYRIWKGN